MRTMPAPLRARRGLAAGADERTVRGVRFPLVVLALRDPHEFLTPICRGENTAMTDPPVPDRLPGSAGKPGRRTARYERLRGWPDLRWASLERAVAEVVVGRVRT